MNSIVWLGATVIMVVVVVLSGLSPKGGKPVARSALMKRARGFLLVGIVVCGAFGIWSALKH